jgi:Uma2 family endonuclease
MASLADSLVSPEEYLRREREAEYKSEYIDGQIVAMSGATEKHNLITGDIYLELRSALRGRPCRVYMSDLRVRVRSNYTYPDIAVVCEEPRFQDSALDTLLNPVLILEVLSKTTERYDRGIKFGYYRKIESLQEYVLVSQDAAHVESFPRQPDGKWLLTEVDGLNASVQLASLQVAFKLAEIYRQVEMP